MKCIKTCEKEIDYNEILFLMGKYLYPYRRNIIIHAKKYKTFTTDANIYNRRRESVYNGLFFSPMQPHLLRFY